MNARSALFDLYGDHVRSRGGAAPVAALMRLLAPLGVAGPAVRTAVSRMVRQGWLEPVRLPGGPGYALTPRAHRRLDEAAARVYRTAASGPWDRRWHLIVITEPGPRAARNRLRAGLGFLGYAPLSESTWIGPRASAEVDGLVAAEGARAELFRGEHDGITGALVREAWDLEELGRDYRRWLDEARSLLAGERDGLDEHGPASDEDAFAQRFRLVHEWRKFLFRDPGLPTELLPPVWPGDAAAAFFDDRAGLLAPAAGRFVDSCLAP